jgi:outer membrane protein TolC
VALKAKFTIVTLLALQTLQAMPLDVLIEKALEKSSVVQKARMQHELMRQKRREKHASQFGSIDLSASYTHYNLPRTLAPLTPAIMKDPAVAAHVATTEDLFSTGVRYAVPLFTGFAVTQEIRIADIAETMARAKVRLSQEELAYNLSSMYVTILALQENARAQKRYIEALKRLRKTVKKSVKLGKKAPVDLLKIDAQIAQAVASKAAIKGNIASLKAAMEALSGVRIKRFEPVSVRLSRNVAERAKKSDLNTLLKMKTARMQRQKAERALEKSRAAYYPHVALNAYYGYNYGQNDDTNPYAGEWENEKLWQVGVQAEWNLFDFGARESRTQQAKIAAMQARIDEMQTSRDLRKLLAQAVAKVEENYEAYVAAARQYDAARKSAAVEKVRYEKGSASINDLLYAEANALMAQSAKIRYRYEWKKADYFLNYLLERGVKK